MRLSSIISSLLLLSLLLSTCSTPTESLSPTETPTSEPQPTSTHSPEQTERLGIMNAYLEYILRNEPQKSIVLFTDDAMLDSGEDVFIGKDKIPTYLESLEDTHFIGIELGRPMFRGDLVELNLTFTSENGESKIYIYDFLFEDGKISKLYFNPVYGT